MILIKKMPSMISFQNNGETGLELMPENKSKQMDFMKLLLTMED